jgi:thiol-disulfide isomerase/thioredoxin
MRLFWLAAFAGICTVGASGQVIGDVRDAMADHDFSRAERIIQSDHEKNGVTPQLLEALSWMARGALEAKQYDQAERYAQETRKLSLEALARRKMDDERHLPIALGASIEVHAQALAARGERTEALAFLRRELAAYGTTSLAARIQKNINLLRLEGKPAPPLEESQWLGPKPATLAQLKGHPVLLFFWAHWCGDCKAEAPILARLLAEYKKAELILIGPSQHYGYTAGGDDASREQETRYIDEIRKQYYAPLAQMSVPLSQQNFITYGASTTPTLVLIDRQGIVRLYHPGTMPYAQLAAQVAQVAGN